MRKVMLALSGDAGPDLHDEAFRSALADAGADRLQLNVDDEAVAAAMRIPAGDIAVTAIVSVWTPGPVDAVVDVVGSLGLGFAGWEVEERRPIEPPEAWDGSRLDALANVALLRRPDELTVEEWRHNWLVDHTPVAIATQATFGYVQNVVTAALTPPLTPAAPPVVALVEELFPSAGITDIHAFYGSGGDDAELNDRLTRLMASCARFGADRGLDLVPSSRYLYRL